LFIKALYFYRDASGVSAPKPAATPRPLLVGLLCSAVLLIVCRVVHALPDAAEPEPQSRFERTVAALQDDTTGQGVAFASIALARLADAYAAEARLAREQARGADQGTHLRGWSVAVDGYARQMLLLLEDINQGYPVRMIVGNEAAPAVTVADRTVIISHPRPSQQSAFEQEILREFCASHHCDYTTAEERAEEPIPVFSRLVKPAWSFTQDGPSCSHQGITVYFSSERNLANSRAICEQLMREAELLADEMAWQYRHAVSIDWQGLAIAATPGGPEHMVRLNGAGDVLLVSVPLLYSTPALLPELIPWVQGQIGDRKEIDVELDAVTYGWQDP
jgi:hypothetical protein